jgi:hypothetical protein
MGLSFSVKLHLFLTGNTLIHYGYFSKLSYLFPILDCREKLGNKNWYISFKSLIQVFTQEIGPLVIFFLF